MKNYRLKTIQVKNSDNDPYKDDLLDRNVSGDNLINLIKSFSESFVLAINGKWGSGKTTFVKMWQKELENDGYRTIYFNAWEMDFVEDPLIGIIGEFKKMTTTKDEELIKKFTNVVRKVSFSMVPSLLSLSAEFMTGLNLKDVIKDGSKRAMEIMNEYVNNYIKQQESIKEFRKALTEYVHELSSNKPIIFIIDELDRCKPDFSVKALERIKHLFAVKNVVFVLAIDRTQLEHSICGFYGSDMIDADDYLRRFIDIQYDLPVGNYSRLINKVVDRFLNYDYLSKYVDTIIKDNEADDEKNSQYCSESHKQLFLETEHTNMNEGGNEFEDEDEYEYEDEDEDEDEYEDEDEETIIFNSIVRFVEVVYSNQSLSIRQLEKWMLHSSLVIEGIHSAIINNDEDILSPITIIFLVYLHDFDSLFYNDLIKYRLSDQEVLDRLVHFFPHLGFHLYEEEYQMICEILKMRYYYREDLFQERIIDNNGKLLLNLCNCFIEEEKFLKRIIEIKDVPMPSFADINHWISTFNPLFTFDLSRVETPPL